MSETEKPDKQAMNTSTKCPRCGGALRSSPTDRGALSRYDNETVVCRRCEMHEALVHANVGIAAVHPVTGLRPWQQWQ
jgi:hypothetical protein